MDYQERVERLVAAGAISAGQAEALLEGIGNEPPAPASRPRRTVWILLAAAALTTALALAALLGGGAAEPAGIQNVAETLNQPGSIGTMNRTVGVVAAIGLLLVVPLLIVTFSYNSLVAREEAVFSAWSDVESTYQRRSDLIPQLVESVSRYLKHESETVAAVAEKRTTPLRDAVDQVLARQADNRAALSALGSDPTGDEGALTRLSQSDQALGQALQGFRAVAEAYPELKSGDQFLELQAQLEGTENRINVARLRFNDAAQSFNTAMRQLPVSLIAGLGGFQRKAYFKADAGSARAKSLGL